MTRGIKETSDIMNFLTDLVETIEIEFPIKKCLYTWVCDNQVEKICNLMQVSLGRSSVHSFISNVDCS